MGSVQIPTPENLTMLQAFEWYIPADNKHWQRLRGEIPNLKAIGIDNIWIPPGCKASVPEGNGYDIYDLYDLGEFNQKGTTKTKWGTYEELKKLAQEANITGVGIYWDAVLNHKAAADHTERCNAQEVDPNEQSKNISEPYEIESWVGFDFSGRGEKYSKQKYHWYHFTGTDWDSIRNKSATYKILGNKKNSGMKPGNVNPEAQDFDYLMFADLDYHHPEVQADVLAWGRWLSKKLPLKGMRFDAVKHFPEEFLLKFISHLNKAHGEDWFYVSEFWSGNFKVLSKYLNRMQRKVSLFDAPLIYNFSRASRTEGADLREVFRETLVDAEPDNAVTFVMNHDTQPHQACEAPIEPFFKPLAYALILLRANGYPCVFYGDLYGIDPKNEKQSFPSSCRGALPDLILARKLYAYGMQIDYFDCANCLGWIRYGTWDKPWGCATILSNSRDKTPVSQKRMHVGEMHAGEIWTDVLGWEKEEVKIGEDGCGIFTCGGGSVSVWVNKHAGGRERFQQFDADIYRD